MLQRCIGIAALALLATVAARPAWAKGDISYLNLIGDKEIPGDTPAKAFDRLLKAGNIKVVTSTLAGVDPKDVPPKQFADLMKVNRHLRAHAQSWFEMGDHVPENMKLVRVLHELTKKLFDAHGSKCADLHVARGHAVAAFTLESLNRKDAVDASSAFDGATADCVKASTLDPERKAEFLLDAAIVLRTAVPHVGKLRWSVLDRVDGLLKQAADAGTSKARDAEEAWTHLLRAQWALRDKKHKKEARPAFERGLALVEPTRGELSARAAGAYNELIQLARAHKWIKDDRPLLTTSETRGGFAYDYPRGCGWELGDEKKQTGHGRVLLQRLEPDGTWVEVGVTAFAPDKSYGKGDIPGDNAKALLVLMRESWKADLRRPKKKSPPKLLPSWAKKANGYHILGGTERGVPMTIFGWTCKGACPNVIYGITVVVDGALASKMPAQAELIVKSLREQAVAKK